MSAQAYLPLWFNQPDGAMLFQFLKQPISYHQYTGGNEKGSASTTACSGRILGAGARRGARREGAFHSSVSSLDQRRRWVVSGPNLSEFGPRRGPPRLASECTQNRRKNPLHHGRVDGGHDS